MNLPKQATDKELLAKVSELTFVNSALKARLEECEKVLQNIADLKVVNTKLSRHHSIDAYADAFEATSDYARECLQRWHYMRERV